MTFYNWELDICPSFGWQGGPNANTKVDTLKNRHERRLARSDLMQHIFQLPFDAIDDDVYYEKLKSTHAVMYGMAHSFLVLDHLDFEATLEPLGVTPSGSTPVQLQKTYSIELDGLVLGSRTRPITKPRDVAVYQADGSGNPVLKAGTTDPLTGLFTPSTAWTSLRQLWWSGTFLVPVRFNNDYMPASIDARNENRKFIRGMVELVEVFGE